MAPKSPKRKVIDGVVKPKKSTAKGSKSTASNAANTKAAASKTQKRKPAAPFEDEPINISVEDTALAITVNDPDSKNISSNYEDDVATAIENFADAKISEPAIDDEPADNKSNSNKSSKKDGKSDSDDSEDDENKDAAAVAIATGAAVAENAIDGFADDGLVSSAILEDEVIDKNLDDLINDIENERNAEESPDESIESVSEDSPESTSEKPEKTAKEETIADLIKNDTEDKDTEKAIAEDKKAEKAIKAIEKQNKEKPNKKSSKPKKNKSAKKPANAKPFRIISRILALVATGSLIALGARIATTGILPNKYLIPGCVAAALVLFFVIFKAFRNKTRIPMLIVVDILSVLLSAVSIFGFIKIDETMAFLNRNFTDNTEYSIYNVVVSKQSNFNKLDDVRGKTFHSISDFVDTKNLEEAAKEQANATIAYESGITNLLDKTLDSTTYISVINSGTYEGVTSSDADKDHKYSDGLKVIGELKVKVEKKNKSTSSLTEESSVIYLSGIDTRSGQMLDRSLSDVNIVITINPKTKEILMTTIPRDYYVQLHGTSGLPDKLTHAGALGGVQLSMDTIGDLLDVEFNRYIRVNFNFVIDLVNAVGGITVYSDVDYDIKAWTDSSCVFHPGNNEVDGKCALAFARERYAYSDGDRHRGRNQEQVIEKILNKVSTSSTLIGRYSEILNSLNGSFDTDITASDITGLANMQLNDMARWTINTYNLDGNTGSAYTYSYPGQQLSVMFPNQETVNTARQKIDQIMSGFADN